MAGLIWFDLEFGRIPSMALIVHRPGPGDLEKARG